MNCVGFAQAEAFCSWERKRLPTEIEWEVAAARDLVHDAALPYDDVARSICLTSELSSYGPPPRPSYDRAVGTCPVIDKPKPDSKLGLIDMMGNVSEWTTSRFCEQGPGCEDRALRGTAWLGDLYESFRHRWRGPGPGGLDKGHRIPSQIGFRCARDAPAHPR
jgi:formylglycine-generating enzyme